MPAATLTEKGQIVIPAEIRARYQLTPGTQVEFADEGGTHPPGCPAEGGSIRSGGRLRDDQDQAQARAQGLRAGCPTSTLRRCSGRARRRA